MPNDETSAHWPGWETVRLLGEGDFGAVYEICREIDGKLERAAMKSFSIPRKVELAYMEVNQYDHESARAFCADSRDRVLREYALMAKMKGHPNIVYCDGASAVSHADGIGWDVLIKMELLTPLVQVLPDAIDETLVIRIGMDMCGALDRCREAKIIHRDIKPSNIFVSDDGTHKLGDFGLARIMEEMTLGSFIGNLLFMAPEVYNRQKHGPSSDLYSMGLVLHWLLNDRRAPFIEVRKNKPTSSEMAAVRTRRFNGEPLPPPQNGSDALKQIVLRACAYEPGDRYAEPMELKRALEALLR